MEGFSDNSGQEVPKDPDVVLGACRGLCYGLAGAQRTLMWFGGYPRVLWIGGSSEKADLEAEGPCCDKR